MSISIINICRACLAKCHEDKVIFESLKEIFTELTSLQDTTELPKYLCKNCSEMLNQFKHFKDTCIESDTHLRKAVANTTLPLLPVELIKVECQAFDAEDDPSSKPTTKPIQLSLKRKRKHTKKQEALSNRRKPRSKRQVAKEQKVQSDDENEELEKINTDVDNATEDERPTFKTAEDSFSEDDEHFVEPTKKSSKSDSKIPVDLQYKCSRPNCRRKFPDEVRLHIHLRKHDGFDPNICDICEKPLTSSRIMLRHRLTHQSLEERSHKCPICNKITLTEGSLKYHMKTHEATKSFVCDVCGVGCISSWALRSHKDTHNSDQSSFQCKQCPKSYATYLTLYNHVKNKHGKKESPAACDICGTVVRAKSLLFSHCKNRHTVYTTTDNIFQCKLCDVKCKTPSGLKKHEQLHTGERKYQCPVCPKAFAHLELLKRHSYFHSGERPVRCEVCDKGFYQKCALDIHMNVHKKQWIAQGLQGITLTTYKQTKKMKARDTQPNEYGDYSADSSGYV